MRGHSDYSLCTVYGQRLHLGYHCVCCHRFGDRACGGRGKETKYTTLTRGTLGLFDFRLSVCRSFLLSTSASGCEISSFISTLTIYSNSITNGGILSDLFRTQNLFGGFDTPVLIRELSAQLNYLSAFLSQGIFSVASLIFGGIFNFVLILVLSFYLVAQEDGVSKFLKMITPMQHERYVIGLWRRSQHKIGLWMQGQLLSSALMALLVYLSLLIIGVPHALLLAVLAGVFELIPLVGATLAAIPTIFIAYTWGGMSIALIVAGLYIVIQQLEGHLIYPLVVKKMVGIPPIISIVSLVIGGTLAGFLGALISVPVAAALMEFISDFEERKIAKLSETS